MIFTKTDVERSIPARFEQQVTRHPSRVAIKTEAVTQTYDILNRAANRLAHALLSRADLVKHGDDVRHRGTIALLFDGCRSHTEVANWR